MSSYQFCGVSVNDVQSSIGWNGKSSTLTVTMYPDDGETFSAPLPGAPATFTVGSFTFRGLIKRYTEDVDISGNPRYTVYLEDPRSLLSNTKIITGGYGGSVYTVKNLINVFGYYENISFGGANVNESGMPWQLVRDGLLTICNGSPGTYGGPITYTDENSNTFTYSLNLSNLPALPSYYRIQTNGSLSVLDFISEVCETANYDFFITLESYTIKVYTVSRLAQPALGQLSTIISGTFGGIVAGKSIGLEQKDETSSVFLTGGFQNRLFKRSDNFHAFYGFDSSGNISTVLSRYLELRDEAGDLVRNVYTKTFTLYLPEVADILSTSDYSCSEFELRLLLGDESGGTWEGYLQKFKPSIWGLIGGTSVRDLTARINFNRNFVGPPRPNELVNTNVGVVDSITAGMLSNMARLNKVTRLKDALLRVAKENYGKKFVINLPFVYYYEDPETSIKNYDWNVSDGGWVDSDGENDLSGLPSLFRDLFKDQDGKYVAFVAYDFTDYVSSNIYPDLRKINPTNSLYYTSNNKLYLKCSLVENKIFYNGGLASVIVNVEGVYRFPSDVTGDLSILNALNRATSQTTTASNNTPTVPAGDNITSSVRNSAGGTPTVRISPDYFTPIDFHIPLKSSVYSYGPWYAIGKPGNTKYLQDSSLVPWNYGGYTYLDFIGASIVDDAVSNMQLSETGYIKIADIPAYGLGAEIISGGPVISDIKIQINDREISTTYRFETYTVRFGQLNKAATDRIAKLARLNNFYSVESANALRTQILNNFISSNANGGVSNFGVLQSSRPAVRRESPHNIIGLQLYNTSGSFSYNSLIATATIEESLGMIPPSGTSFMSSVVGGIDQVLKPFSVYGSGYIIPHIDAPTGVWNDSSVLTGYLFNPFTVNPSGFLTDIVSFGYNYDNMQFKYATVTGSYPANSGIFSDNTVIKRGFSFPSPFVLNGWGYDIHGNLTPSGFQRHVDISVHKAGPIDPLWDDKRKVWTVHGFKLAKLSDTLAINSFSRAKTIKYTNNTSTSGVLSDEEIRVFNPFTVSISSGTIIQMCYNGENNRWMVVQSNC